jgi:hypothetical protein
MSEVVRKLAQHVRFSLWVLRRERRFPVEAEAALMASHGVKDGSPPNVLAYGRTTDLSAHGAGLVINSISKVHSYLAIGAGPVTLRVTLKHRAVLMEVEPKRYDRLDGEEHAFRFAVGLRITKISDEDEADYLAFLKTFERKGSEARDGAAHRPVSSLPLTER